MKLIKVNVLKEWVENWFTKNRSYHPYAKNNNIPITELYDILEQMPSAQRKGRWMDYPIADGCIQCSVCGVLRMGEPSNFCPNCGAKMEK